MEMDCLVAYYNEKFKKLDGNVFEVFTAFYNSDLTPINSWLEAQFKSKTVKNNHISVLHRREGNAFYAKKDLVKSLEFYTKSLCFATPYSKEYGLALANRSAVSFEMKEFQDCLKDIELCFKTNYPTDLKPKIYIRKAECFLELDQKEALQKCIGEVLSFLDAQKISDKDKFVIKLMHIKKLNSTVQPKMDYYSDGNFQDMPEFPNGENENFAYASSKIKMSYSTTRGRHVVANSRIQRGEVLFIEKAFVFAPVFKDNKEFYTFKCYSCLKDIISSVPCKSCTICIYCDESCRDLSWKACHKWECVGMQASIWYDLGIAFPAFKAMLKGVKSGFKSNSESNFEEDLKKFGDKSENYQYFNRLLSNIYKNKNIGPYIVMAAIVITYLNRYTDFFNWFTKQANCPKEKNLLNFFGGLITKHIAQLACNSSTIEHWTSSSSDLLFPDVLITIACGIYPSVSILNHSCRPNVTNFFICDTIVVKALEEISENEEILNCYGIDYRGMAKEQRQFACRKLYHFECKCVICSDPEKELFMLDSFLCPKCKGLVPDTSSAVLSYCQKCREKYHLKPFRKINSEAQKYLERDDEMNQLELLVKSLKIREKILHKHHKDFEEVYYRLYSYYVEHGDAENMFKYFHLWLENEKARRGQNSRGIGTKLYEAALAILHCLQNGQTKNNINLKAFLQNVEYMIKEAKIILNLYYPAYITNRLNRKIQFISTK